MPRPLRIHAPGAFYHVTLRGNHRQSIFFAHADRRLLDDITADALTRFSARLHAYCWMTNHLHLLVQVSDAPLGRLMHRIAGRYARTVQKRLHTTGHLFEKRYHAVLVDADEYLLELLRYIHLNPVRARMVAHPTEYPWSSHQVYLGAVQQSWVTNEFALRVFHSEHNKAVQAYRRFIDADVLCPSASPLLERNPSDSRILGSDRFAERVLGTEWRARSRVTLEELIAQACARFAVTPTSLPSRSCERRLTQARAWIAHQAVSLRIASLSHVARALNRNESSLRESVKHHFGRS